MAAEGGAERRAEAGDLVFGLERAHAEVLVLRQLVEDVRRRRDRVAAEQHRQLGELAGGDEPPRQRGVAGDVRVEPGRQRCRLHLVAVVEQLGGLAEVVARPGRRPGSASRTGGLAAKRSSIHSSVVLGRPGVEPRDEPEGEEVLGPVGITRLHAERQGGLLGERGHRHLDHLVARQAAVGERVGGRPGLGQAALVEGVGVDDEHAAALQAPQIGHERGRVHGHEDVARVTGRGDVVVGDVHLEARHAHDGARRRADLGREVGQRAQVVAEGSAHGGEPIARELHAVAGVPGEPDDDAIQELSGARWWRSGVGHRSSPLTDREQVVAPTLPPGEPRTTNGLVRPP